MKQEKYHTYNLLSNKNNQYTTNAKAWVRILSTRTSHGYVHSANLQAQRLGANVYLCNTSLTVVMVYQRNSGKSEHGAYELIASFVVY